MPSERENSTASASTALGAGLTGRHRKRCGPPPERAAFAGVAGLLAEPAAARRAGARWRRGQQRAAAVHRAVGPQDRVAAGAVPADRQPGLDQCRGRPVNPERGLREAGRAVGHAPHQVPRRREAAVNRGRAGVPVLAERTGEVRGESVARRHAGAPGGVAAARAAVRSRATVDAGEERHGAFPPTSRRWSPTPGWPGTPKRRSPPPRSSTCSSCARAPPW